MHKIFSFRYKLSLLMFFVVLTASLILGVSQYLHMKTALEHDFEHNKSLVKDRVVSSVNDADHMYLFLEDYLAEDAEDILNKVLEKYHEKNSIDFDLYEFLADKEGADLYIIDSNNIIVASTDETDLGLDFNKVSLNFVKELDNIRKNGVFVSERIDLSAIKAEARKYCYLPSPDGKYIFEIGFLVDRYDDALEGIGFDSFENKIIEAYEFVDSITLYDNEGISYKKNNDKDIAIIDEKNREYYNQAIETLEIVEVKDKYNGTKTTYWYVPYEIMNSKGINDVNVIEIIFNDSLLQKHLKDSKYMMTLMSTLAGVLALILGFFLAGYISRPVEKFTAATKEVSEGNFNIRTEVHSNDEFKILSRAFNNMAESIQTLLDERYRYEKKLEEKNKEILGQKEEITALYEETTALYEETTAMNEELEELLKENKKNYFETVRALANAVETKDFYTGGHCERVMHYSLAIAESLELDDYDKNHLRQGSILHDIGKIGIPEHILNKEGKFTEKDYDIMKKHPQMGYEILSNLDFLEKSRKIVLEHHERIDGCGYPEGLKGEEIDLLSKIVCIADAYDAMTSVRPYRTVPLTKEEAIQEMLRNKDIQFDSQIVDVFIKWLREQD